MVFKTFVDWKPFSYLLCLAETTQSLLWLTTEEEDQEERDYRGCWVAQASSDLDGIFTLKVH